MEKQELLKIRPFCVLSMIKNAFECDRWIIGFWIDLTLDDKRDTILSTARVVFRQYICGRGFLEYKNKQRVDNGHMTTWAHYSLSTHTHLDRQMHTWRQIHIFFTCWVVSATISFSLQLEVSKGTHTCVHQQLRSTTEGRTTDGEKWLMYHKQS